MIQDEGVVHEGALWDAAEMALDGASKKERAEPYVPEGGWTVRGAVIT
jgi:hypothetical protein